MNEKVKTILLIEDELITAMVETKQLENEGYKVIQAASGEEAIDIICKKKLPVDIILMDIDLGEGIDGTEAAKEILKYYDIPVVFLSSHTEKEIVRKTENITSYGYVVKNTGIIVLDASIKMAFKLFEAKMNEKEKDDARKHAEDELLKAKEKAEKNEQELIAAQKLSHVGSWIYNIKTQRPKWSDEMFCIWGLNPESGAPEYAEHKKYIHPDDWQIFDDAVKKAAEEGVSYNLELRICRPDGVVKTIITICQPVKDDNGNVIELKGTCQDITDRKQTEDALYASKQKFAKVFQNAPVLISITDIENGVYLDVNDESVKISGFTKEEIIGHKSVDVGWITQENRNRLLDELEAFGRINGIEMEFKTKDGKKIIGFVKGEYITISGENCLLTVMIDITEPKLIEEALKQNEFYLNKAQKIGKTGHFSFDPVTNTVEGSQELFRIFDVDKDQQPLFTAFANAVHPDDKHLILPYIDRAIKEGIPYDVEHRVKHRDGTILYVNAKGENINTLQGMRMVGIVQDITERKSIEDKLQDSNENLQAIVYSSPLAIIATDLYGNVTQWNPAAENIFGWDKSEVLGRFLPYIPDNKQEENRIIREGVTKGKSYSNLELKRLKKDGSLIDINLSTAPLHDAQGKVIGIMSVSIDITEKKSVEEKLTKTVELLEITQASANVGSWYWDINSGELVWSKILYKLFGLDPEKNKASFEIWRSVIHPDDKKTAELNINLAVENHENLVNEYRIIKPDGKTYWINALGKCYYDEKGEPLWMSGICLDVTEKKQSEEILSETQMRFQAILDNTPSLIYVKDIEGKFLLVNRKFETTFNSTREALLGKTSYDILPKDIADIHGANDREVIVKQNPINCEELYNGKHIYFSTKFPIFDTNGKLYAICGISTDITDRKLIDEDLMHKTALLEAQLNSSIDGILIVDNQGKKILQNRRTIELWKIPKYIADDADDNKQVQHVMKMTKNPKQFLDKITYLYNHPAETSYDEVELIDGTVFDRYSAPVLGKEGQYFGRIWIFHDITDRKQAEKMLNENKMRFEQLAEQSNTFIWEVDSNGLYTYVSYISKQVIGYSPEELINIKYFYDIFPETERDTLKKEALTVFKKKEQFVGFENPLLCKDGHTIWVSTNGLPILNADGSLRGYRGSDTDITKRKLSDEQIKNLLKEKELILKEVHHRIKNNMGTILNLLLLQSNSQENAVVKNILQDSAARVQSMMILYEKLFRSSHNSEIPIKEYFTSLVKEIISIFPQKTSVKIETQIDEVIIKANIISPLGIIINELITNSIKYAFKDYNDGIIKVNIFKKENIVNIIYEDNGIGLPYSISMEDSPGFGLQLVGMLVKQIKGSITIERQKGTKFIITIKV